MNALATSLYGIAKKIGETISTYIHTYKSLILMLNDVFKWWFSDKSSQKFRLESFNYRKK